MHRRRIPSALILCLSLVVAGCSYEIVRINQPASDVPPISSVMQASTLDDHAVEVSNCDGEHGRTSLASKAQVVCEVIVESSAAARKTGYPFELTGEMKAQLADQIALVYQGLCDEVKDNIEQTDLEVPAGSIRIFKIHWNRQAVHAEMSFTHEWRVYSVPYTFAIERPTASLSVETGCTT